MVHRGANFTPAKRIHFFSMLCRPSGKQIRLYWPDFDLFCKIIYFELFGKTGESFIQNEKRVQNYLLSDNLQDQNSLETVIPSNGGAGSI